MNTTPEQIQDLAEAVKQANIRIGNAYESAGRLILPLYIKVSGSEVLTYAVIDDQYDLGELVEAQKRAACEAINQHMVRIVPSGGNDVCFNCGLAS